jgi:hypothetical protein
MKLRYNPYQIFSASRTPAGLYARQKWLGEFSARQWRTDFEETVTALLADQADDGSWYQSDIATISKLFGLHLTVRETSARIDSGLNWLLGRIDRRAIGMEPESDADTVKDRLEALPFTASRRNILLTAASLFLAAIFGRQDDSKVTSLYRWLSLEGEKAEGLWIDRACSHNILRAMVVHPVYAKKPATAFAVKALAALQSESGDWGEGSPFYQTLNALAHLDVPEADKQLEKAFVKLTQTQRENGSWGEAEPEWNTFLAVHAFKNKGLL